MATKLDNLELEIAHFNHFKEAIPMFEQMCPKTLDILNSLGMLQISTGFEHAVANTSGHTVISKDEADISDGSDCKLVSVRTSSYGTSYSAPVTNIYNKTGTLRVQVYERKQNKFYYFAIPNSAYRNIPKSSNIEIPFELDGTPRKRLSRTARYANWWNFEVSSFKEMSKK